MTGSKQGRKAKKDSSRKYADGWRRTVKKIPWGQIIGDAALEIVAKGTGFAVSFSGVPGGELAMALGGDMATESTKRLLEYSVRRFTRVYEQGEVSLSEIFGRTIPDKRYRGVGDFWAKVLTDALPDDALIEISGLLSPYGPLMPAHPMSRPGYTVDGWEAMGDLGVEDTEEYDTVDGLIYGDRVIRLSTSRNNKFYAGLYEPYFGISNISIPLYIDRCAITSKHGDLERLWRQPMTGGKIVRVKGRLRKIPSYYAQFVKQVPLRYRTLPSFALEVFEIGSAAAADGVTHMAVAVSWKRRTEEERMITHYFNVQDRSQFTKAEQLLDKERDKHSGALLFNYDDLTCYSSKWRHKIPEYNAMLRPWLEGESI